MLVTLLQSDPWGYDELATVLRTLAGVALHPAARRELIRLAKRFEITSRLHNGSAVSIDEIINATGARLPLRRDLG